MKSIHRPLAVGIATLLAYLVAQPAAEAASQIWTGGSTVDGNWGTVANWNGAVPGSTTVTNNADTATFNTAIANTWGDSASNPIVIDAGRNLTSLTFDTNAGNYFIGSTGGNALRLTSGGTITLAATLTGTNKVITVNAPLSLSGSLTLNNNIAAAGVAALNIGGSITYAGATTATLTLSGSGGGGNDNIVSGLISNGTNGGTLSLSKLNGPTYTLNNDSNSFTGLVNMAAGNLRFSSIGASGANSAAGAGTTISIGALSSSASMTYIGTGNETNRTIRINGSSSSNIFQSGTGLLKFTGTFDVSQNIASKVVSLQGSTAGTGEVASVIADNGTTGTTSLASTFAAGVTSINVGSGTGYATGATITGTGIAGGTTITGISITASSTTLTLSQATNGASGTVGTQYTIPGVTNLTSVSKNGTGTWTLSGNNTYSGATTVAGGTLQLAHPNALGNTTGATSIASGAVVDLNGQAIGAENFTVTGSLLNNSPTPVTLGGTVTLASGNILGGSGNIALTLGLVGNFAFTKTGAGTVTLNADAPTRTSAATTISGGTLVVKSNGALGTNATANNNAVGITNATLEISGSGLVLDNGLSLNANNGATIRSDGSNTTNARINVTAAASVTLATVNAADVFTVGNGSSDLTGGAGSTLRVSGPGTVLLSLSSNYTGNTVIDSGTLLLQGSTAALGATDTATLTLNGGSLRANFANSSSFVTGAGNNVVVTAPSTIIPDRTTVSAGLTYTFGNLTVGASQLNIAGGVTNSGTAGVTFGATTLTGNATFNVTNPAAGGTTLLTPGTISGGAFGVTKSGNGSLTYSGTSANTYTGLTSVTGGRLTLNKTGVNAVAGNLSISGGAILVYGAGGVQDQLAGTTVVSVSGAGSVFNGTGVNANVTIFEETFAGLNVNGGVVNAGGAGSNWNITGTASFTGQSGAGSTFFVGNSGFNMSVGALELTGMTGTTIVTSPDGFVVGGTSTTNQSTLKVGAGGLSLNGSVLGLNRGSTATQLGSRLVLDGNVTTTGTAPSFIASNTGTLGARDLELSSTAGTATRTFTTGGGGADLTVSVPITNGAATIGGIIKDGAGKLTLTQTNTYTGPTTVTGGILEISGVAGSISASSEVNVTGGTLLLGGAGDKIGTVPVTLDNGRLGFTSGGTGGFSETLGALTLSTTSTLDFGSGTTAGNTFSFSNFSSGTIAGLNGGTLALNIWNWSGTPYDPAATLDPGTDLAQDRLVFNTLAGLNDDGFGRISFYSGSGSGFLGTGNDVAFGGTFEIVPIPEPSSTALLGALGLFGLVGFRERRRLLGLKRG